MIQHLSSDVCDDAFIESCLHHLCDLQTDDEKAIGRSIHKNQQGLDSSDAVRLAKNGGSESLSREEKLDLIIKYSGQIASLIMSGAIEAPSQWVKKPSDRARRLLKRRRPTVIVEETSSDEDCIDDQCDEEEPEPLARVEMGVTPHGICQGSEYIFPSKSFMKTLSRIRDEVVLEARAQGFKKWGWRSGSH